MTQSQTQPARNGFEALPLAEKKWFLVRVQSLSHAFAPEKQAVKQPSIA
ncbi:MAG: hypothetical protein WC342_05440 [Methanoregula sp.]|jgi:hypothetical protein